MAQPLSRHMHACGKRIWGLVFGAPEFVRRLVNVVMGHGLPLIACYF